MKIINITEEQVDSINAGEQIQISLIESKVNPEDDVIFTSGTKVAYAKVKSVQIINIQDIDIPEMYSEGIRVDIPPILEKGPSFPDGFDEFTDEKKNRYFQDAARATYIAQCKLSESIKKAYIKRWNIGVQNLHEKFRYENNPVVTVIEFDSNVA